ncbi:protein bassoon isoform X3 [Stigmatopora nigra]
MGNEASMEGEGQAGQGGQGGPCPVPAAGAPASISAPPDSGQLLKPSNGAPAGGSGPGPGPGINRSPASDQGAKTGVHSSHGTGDRLASHDTPQAAQSHGEQGHGHMSRKNLHVDVVSSRTGRSPSVSPDRGCTPTSPYSVPQIAPMPSSKLCPVCKTADLTGTGDDRPSFNTCTLCRSMVCNQCGFNPNPHLTEVQEWLCLNCQMQRALGMDMTTPRSKSQQQINSPSHAAKPELKPDPSSQLTPQTSPQIRPGPQHQDHGSTSKQTGPAQQQIKLPPGAVPLPGMAKAPSQPDLSRNTPVHQTHHPRQDHTRSAGSSPSRQPPPPEQTFGKLFGFGASLLNQATTLISETTQPQQQPAKQAPKPGGQHGPGPGAPKHSEPRSTQQGSRSPPQHQTTPPDSSKPKVSCPLCKMLLNIGNTTEQPNYNTCTQCHSKVCNKCGFNPTPHLVEKQEWLCLNCQTQRALSGSLGDIPGPAASNQQPPQQKDGVPHSGPRPTGPQQQQKALGPQDYIKSSSQSLSDTGYSSDGISSYQGEIIGKIHEDAVKLNERGVPISSEITKLETSMKPLLESKASSDQKHRPYSLSVRQGCDISPDDDAARDESDDELSCKLRHDYVEDSSESGLSPLPVRQKKAHKDLTEEEFMRRQIMEMSADEDELEGYGDQKAKKGNKTSGDLNKERRRLPHHSSSFEDAAKDSEGLYKAEEEEDVAMAGGLRRFKTIELNNTNSYNRDMELSTEHDLREPELEMESLTGSPEERSKGEYSSTLPATTPSYTSGTSPTSVSSMEDDSDSSPSRARLEEAKQQRKARHRSHGPLLPTIEDSSEEDELREEEELLREQEQMRDLEQQRIRSTARKTKRDKEELRAQRRRERSKTPPSNLSPIEDASPTEELRQAAEMEELHRSSCSEYSPSMDSEAEGFEIIGGKLYKSGNEFNLPTFTSLYSPTEKTSCMSSTDKTLKSAEEVYEEMMRKAQFLQKQGRNMQQKHSLTENANLETASALTPGSSPTQITAPMSFPASGIHAGHLSKETQNRLVSQSAKIEGVVGGVTTTKIQGSHTSTTRNAAGLGTQRSAQASTDSATSSSSLTSKVFSLFKGPSPQSSPTTSPVQSPTHTPLVRPTGSGGRQLPTLPGGPSSTSHGAPRSNSPRLVRQQSSQDSPVMAKPVTVNSSTSPLSSPTEVSYKTLYSSQHSAGSSPPSPPMHPSQLSQRHCSPMNVEKTNFADSTQSQCSPSMENFGTLSMGQSQTHPTTIVDLRAPMRSAPIIMTDQGMDLTSLASDSRRYSIGAEQQSVRHTAVQPLIMNLNAQEQRHIPASTTVSVTVAGSVFISQPKQTVVYGDPLQNRVDLGQGVGSAVCLSQSKTPVSDPFIPKIDACLENLGIQQQQLQIQQQKLLQQQQLLEQQLQQHQQQTSFARFNLANHTPLVIKKDLIVNQTTSSQPVVTARVAPLATQPVCSASHEIYGGVALELQNKPTVMNLSTGKPHVMMVQIDENKTSPAGAVTQLLKKDDSPPTPQVLDLTGQIKPENQVACCDVVYNLPFAGSCAGSFTQKPTALSPDKKGITETPKLPPPPLPHHVHYNISQQQQFQATQGVKEENNPYQKPITPSGRIQPSMSDTNLPTMNEGSHCQMNLKGGMAVDLTNMNQNYDSGYLGMGAQYGSYTDLRHQGDITGPTLPMRRYGSLSNINSEYGYGSKDLTGQQDSNLAQMSATTAREISQMCSALNTVDHFATRFGHNPELMPYGVGRGGHLGRLNLQQSLASIRASLMYGPDGRALPNGQTLTNLINARQASIRALYPAALRGGDGMIYSTINAPIASTLPITTQPGPVLHPMPRGIYRPYPTGVTAVPLASITRLPQVNPKTPLTTQGTYPHPSLSQYTTTTSGSMSTLSTSQDETPMYLGKPSTAAPIIPPPQVASPQNTLGACIQTTSVQQMNQTQHSSQMSIAQSQGQLPNAKSTQMQPQQLPAQTEPLSLTQTHLQAQSINQPQHAVLTHGNITTGDTGSTSKTSSAVDAQKDKEDERLSQQQEHMLQLERERVELEKMRQLRLHEELERDRMELQRHREKEQLIVQREIQELHTIKQQVLQQQQAERETQLIMQREQLAQQRMQLEQIQSLQQQLQMQLEEQKRQKTAAAAVAAEAAAASATTAATSAQGAIQGVVVSGAAPQGFLICDQSGRVIQQEGQTVQFWQDGQVVQAVVSARPIHSSVSEMSLRSTEKQSDSKIMKKQNSMPRLRDSTEDDSGKKIADSCIQTDDEDGEERFINRRRRTRRIADCSVQTDEEDQGDWDQQPVRRRRSRISKHSESSSESKADGSSRSVSASIAIQTSNDSSCQTEPDQLGRVSPAIHITMAESSKVDLLHYIAAPERTRKGESLACQTEPESHSQGVVAPQLSVPTTISPYSTSMHVVSANTCETNSSRQQGVVAKFERRKPDPLEIGYQPQPNECPRQPPKSPQVLYSPVSPLSPHRMLETTFASQEKLNKAHVTPQQKAFTAESPQRQQSLPRPIKSVQRSMSDPKPLSPTSDDPAKNRFSPYHQQPLSNSQQMATLQQQNAAMRKVKRTLPSPPPEESPVPIVTPAQMYSSPGMPQRVLPRPAPGVTKAGLLSELKAVEQESSKLRKQQAELEEEEKEIDAKLRYLELGITQRKETMVKERERREIAYLRCMGDARDYMSDSELNNLRIGTATVTFDANGLLTRPSTAPMSPFANDLNATSQYSTTSSYMSYPYPQNQPSSQQPGSSYHQIGFQPPQYPSSSAPQPGTFQPHPPPGPAYQNQGNYSSRMYSQTSYQTDLGMHQHGPQAFHPPNQPVPGQTLPYPSHSSYQPGLSYPTQADILTVHQRPRQTSLADLEQKLPTNYEVISNPAVSVATSAPETAYGPAYTNAYGQYRHSEPGHMHSGESPTSAYVSDEQYTSNLEQNIPRNYVMIDDISELTKENTGPATDALGPPVGGRYRTENGPGRGSPYGRPEDEPVDAYGRPTGTMAYQSTVDSRTSTTVSGGTYYYDDYKHSSRGNSGSHKVSPKNLAPAVVSSKRSKHRKQGMEQKISKFSPIEEARDVEADLASYTMTTSTGGSCTVVSRTKKHDELAYSMKRNAYDQQKYYGASREGLEEEDHMYSSGRSRSTGYGMDKISSRDTSGHRSKSYERDAMERSQRSSRSGRPPIRNQNSEEESPISPVGKPVGIGRSSAVPNAHDVRNQYGSSHSLPDVQDHHKKDLPRSHVYKPDDPYLVDDMNCAVSDSEAYHLGQEETDWFEKPREARSERSRHHRGGNQSSSGRRAKHTYHDYDDPPEEYGPQDENHQRHPSSASSRDQRYHGNTSGRHNSSRHVSEDPRSSRSSRTHPKDTSARPDGRSTSSTQRRGGPDSRSTQGSPRNSGDFSRDQAAGHHHGTGGRSQRQQGERTRRQDAPTSGSKMQQQGHVGQQRSSVPSQPGRHQGSEPLDAIQQPQQQQLSAQQQQLPQPQSQLLTNNQPTTTVGTAPSSQQQQQPKTTPAQTQGRPSGGAPAAAQPTTTAVKMDATPSATSIGMKPSMAVPTIPQTTKTTAPPLTGIGSKAAPVGIGSKAGGIGSAAAGQAPTEGENVLSKILQGGAAEQAGKLGDALSGLGKKFTSFF